MIVIFAALSLLGVVVAVVLPGWSDLLLLAGSCLVASLWLCWRGRAKPMPQPAGPHVIIDGSNVMYWKKGTPSIVPVVSAVLKMEAQGFTVGVIFDANAGYKTADRYQGDRAMARQLGLAEDRVLVVPKGVQADEYILSAARDLGARVMTNDRYRDWLDRFPEVAEPGFLIRGGASDAGEVWLEMRDLAAGGPVAAGP